MKKKNVEVKIISIFVAIWGLLLFLAAMRILVVTQKEQSILDTTSLVQGLLCSYICISGFRAFRKFTRMNMNNLCSSIGLLGYFFTFTLVSKSALEKGWIEKDQIWIVHLFSLLVLVAVFALSRKLLGRYVAVDSEVKSSEKNPQDYLLNENERAK